MVSLKWVTYPNGKNEKRSHCNGWPTHVKNMKNGHIVMGDLPKWKKNWSHCNGWPPKMEKNVKNSLVVMGVSR